MYITKHISQEPVMTRLATPNIATMTELREPQKVFDRAGGQPVAILKNSALVGYLVPAEAVQRVEQMGHRYATMEEVMEVIERTRERVQPVLDYLKDK
jgi:antitoxin StbD